MDNASLQTIADDASKRQFWIKPVGNPDAPPDLNATFTEPRIRIEFAREPTTLKVGHVLFVYLVGVSKLIYVAECYTPVRKARGEEIAKEPWRARWCWSIYGVNLSPTYGKSWSQHSLRPFDLLRAYQEVNPADKQSLGGIQHGADKQRVSCGFGEFLLRRVIEL
jgi:hypothetical protein